MKLRSVTDIGVKRKDNQDNFWSARLEIHDIEAGVICMCDGMGGLKDGGLASKMVAQNVKEFFTKSLDLDELRTSIDKANYDIRQIGQERGGRMGTTCTILLCQAGYYRVLHIGDSRCYHISPSKGTVKKVTKDHTVLEKYRREGKHLTPEQKKKYSNTLTKCIGVSDSIFMDSYTGIYDSGDIFLLCTDGFWHTIEKEGLILENLDDLYAMVDNCKVHGETDNITACILEV